MPPARPKSQKFAALSAAERARRISKISDPKKRAAARRFWDVGEPERFDKAARKYAPSAPKREEGNILERAAEDLPKLGKAIVGQAKEFGGAVREDVEKGRGLSGGWYYGASRTPILPQLSGSLIALQKAGVLPEPKRPYEYKKLPKSEQRSALDVLGERMVKEYPEQIKMLADPTAWSNDPLIQLANLGSLVIPQARMAGIIRISKGFKVANPRMSTAQATKAAIVESYNPGFMKAQGVEGGIKPRKIKGKYGEAAGRMPSRGPIGRGGQKAWDVSGEVIESKLGAQAPFSASRRAAALQRRIDARLERQRQARAKKHEDAVAKALTPSKTGRAKQILGLGGKQDPAVAAALVAALEGPEGISVADAAALRIEAKTKILEENEDLAARQGEIDDLHRQADELEEEKARAAEEAEIEGEEFDPTPHDEQIAAIRGDASNRTDMLDFDLKRRIPEVTGSATRASVHRAMVQSIGRKQADETIQVYDAVARAQSPENPTDWYETKLAPARAGKLEEFEPQTAVQYQRTQAPGDLRMTQRGFHFQIERALEDLGDKPMQAGQLLGELQRRGVTPEELRNSGVGAMLEIDKNARVVPGNILVSLDDYFGRFDPEVAVRRADDSIEGPFGETPTRYDPQQMPQINSREGMPGDYHEMTIRVPVGKGWRRSDLHWEDPHIVYHIRYQIFDDEDGNRILLVEEIQSDAGSAFREARKEGAHERSPEETAAEHAELKKDYEDALAQSRKADEEQARAYAEWKQRWADAPPDPNKPNEIDEYQAGRVRIDDLNFKRSAAQDTVWRRGEELSDFERWAPRRVPPSPMGPDRYVKNAVRQIMREADDNDVDKIVITAGATQALRNGKAHPEARVEDGFDNGKYGEYVDQDTGEPLTNEQITEQLKDQDLGSFPRQYDEAIPKHFRDLFGAETEYLDDAYTGRHAAQPSWGEYGERPGYDGYVQTTDSGMPGTVVHLTDEVMDEARKSQPVYRKNMEGIPQGATEWLADGRARITVFEKANVATWIHELAHVALRDLAPDDLSTLEKTIAEGRKLDEWTEADHESFARSFETYMRTGKAHPSLQEIFQKITAWMKRVWHESGPEAEQISPETADVFDRMLGVRYQNSVILDKHEVSQVNAEIADLKKALDRMPEPEASPRLAEPSAPDGPAALTAPAGSTLYHSSYGAEAIEREGFRVSEQGESGAGIYLAPTQSVAKLYPERGFLEVKTTKPLKLLDRTTDEGERIFRQIQYDHPGWIMEMTGEQRIAALRKEGYDGVKYSSGGDMEIVVHDPKALTARRMKPGESDFDAAADALAALSDEAERAGIEIMRRDWKTPEQEAAGMEGLARRKNAIVEDYRRRGLIGPGETARGYFPQFSMWEALGQPQVAPSRVAATGQTVGTPRVTSKAVNKNRNRLVRYQTGEVLNDPAAVMYILRARQRVLATIRAREDLYAVGEPIEAAQRAPDFNPDEFAFIRNPDVAPERMRNATEAMANLSREDFTRLQKRRETETADEIDGAEAIRDEMFWSKKGSKTPKPEWIETEANVRVVPLAVAKNRVGDVFASAPRGRIASVFGTLNAFARAASIYLPLGGARYVFRNWIQNAILLAATQPSAFGKLFDPAWAHRMKKEEPALLHEIDEEIGTIQATALPEYSTRPQGRMQRVERDANRVSGNIGGGLGRFADVPLRRASWRRHAQRYGFETTEDYKRLMDDPELAEIKDTISQRVREDLIDFDATTPFEKEILTRYLFIWPFIRGATKWPFMYAREYPGRLAAASLTSNAINQEDSSGGVSEQLKSAIKGKAFDFAWLNPAGPMLDNAQRLDEFITRNARGEITLKPLVTESLSPQYEYLVKALAGDLGTDPLPQALDTFLPGHKDYEAVKGGKKGIEAYLLKATGHQTASRSIKREANKWTGEVDDIVKWVDEQGSELGPDTVAKLEQMKEAYADWTEESKRAEWAGAEQGKDSLAKAKRAALIIEIVQEHYPEVHARYDAEAKAAGWDSLEEVVAETDDDEQLDAIYQKMRDEMFGLKEQLKRDAKAAGWKE